MKGQDYNSSPILRKPVFMHIPVQSVSRDVAIDTFVFILEEAFLMRNRVVVNKLATSNEVEHSSGHMVISPEVSEKARML